MQKKLHLKKRGLIRFTSLLLTLLFIGVAFLPAREASAATDYSIVRVKLTMDTVTSTTVTIDGNYYIEEAANVAVPRGAYIVKTNGSTLSVTNSAGKVLKSDASSITFVQCQASANQNNHASVKAAGGKLYLGNLKFQTSSAGKLLCVNHIYMEDYLPGVIGAEVGEGSNINALRAQAILARTYAVMMRSPSNSVYDILDTSANQAYHGYKPANAKCRQAVKDTDKLILTCDGEVVGAYYSASNGGYTEMPQHTWGQSKVREPWEAVREDPYDLAHTSSRKEELKVYKDLTSNTLAANLTKYLKDLALAQFATTTYQNQGYNITAYDQITLKTVNSITGTTLRSGSSSENHSVLSTKYCTKHAASKFNWPSDCLDYCPNYTGFTFSVTMRVADQAGEQKDVTMNLLVNANELRPSGQYKTYTVYDGLNTRFFGLSESNTYFSLSQLRF